MKNGIIWVMLFAIAGFVEAEELVLGEVDYPPGKLPYRLLLPDGIESGEKFPLVICLHGGGGKGTDNQGAGCEAMTVLSRPDVQKEHPAILLMPQCPEEAKWVSMVWDEHDRKLGGYNFKNTNTTDQMTAVHSLALEVIKKYPVDEERVYVTGQSMGGMGTWYMVMRWPELFAAAIPVCGVGDPRMAEAIKEVPIRTFHGALDKKIPPETTRAMGFSAHAFFFTSGKGGFAIGRKAQWASAFSRILVFSCGTSSRKGKTRCA